MKILAQASPGNTFGGFQRAAQQASHTWIWWEEHVKPTFDVFDELHPDILFMMEENKTKSLDKCISEYKIPVVIGHKGQPFCFDIRTGDITVSTGFPSGLVDTHIFNTGPKNPQLICKFGVVSKPYPQLLDLCFEQHSVKILHEQPWPVAQYLGVGSLYDKRDLYRSCSIAIADDCFEIGRAHACGAHVVESKDFTYETSSVNISKTIQYQSYDHALEHILKTLNDIEENGI